MKINGLFVRRIKARENCKGMATAVLIPTEQERRTVTLDALELELLAVSEVDEHARCTLYPIDFMKELTILEIDLQSRLIHISDRRIRRRLSSVVGGFRALIQEARETLQAEVPDVEVPPLRLRSTQWTNTLY